MSLRQGRRAVPDARTVSDPHSTNDWFPESGRPSLPDARVRRGRSDVIFSFIRARSFDRTPFRPDRTERRRYRLFGIEDADAFTSRVKGATDAAW